MSKVEREIISINEETYNLSIYFAFLPQHINYISFLGVFQNNGRNDLILKILTGIDLLIYYTNHPSKI